MNPFKALKALLPDAPLLVGTVASISGGVAVVVLPDGGEVAARGAASIGARVFVRDGLIEGAAPILSVELIEV